MGNKQVENKAVFQTSTKSDSQKLDHEERQKRREDGFEAACLRITDKEKQKTYASQAGVSFHCVPTAVF